MESVFGYSYLLFFIILFQYGDYGASYKVTVVKTAEDLQKSLKDASPGEIIYLQATTFKGQFVASQSGTNDSRITVMSSQYLTEGAKIVGQGTNKAALNITGSYWNFDNFTISNRNSIGLLVAGNDNSLRDLVISGVAKAVRIKGDRNTLQDCVIVKAQMGVYLEGDQNALVNNLIVGANPSIFGRKRTCCGTLRSNRYDGKVIVDGANYTIA